MTDENPPAERLLKTAPPSSAAAPAAGEGCEAARACTSAVSVPRHAASLTALGAAAPAEAAAGGMWCAAALSCAGDGWKSQPRAGPRRDSCPVAHGRHADKKRDIVEASRAPALRTCARRWVKCAGLKCGVSVMRAHVCGTIPRKSGRRAAGAAQRLSRAVPLRQDPRLCGAVGRTRLSPQRHQPPPAHATPLGESRAVGENTVAIQAAAQPGTPPPKLALRTRCAVGGCDKGLAIACPLRRLGTVPYKG
eukprot:363278-Chlamydomonas_euryale.AAC.2